MRAAAKGLALALTFLVALVVGVLAHVDLPPVRREVVRRVNEALATAIAGRITIERVDRVSLTGVAGARVRIDDPSGRQLLLADGVRGTIATTRLLRSLVGGGPIVIDVGDASVDAVDARIDGDALAATFAPRSTEPSAPGRGVALTVAHAAIAHAWAHGVPAAGALPVDADLDHVDATVDVAPPRVVVEVKHVAVVTRTYPEAQGEATGRLDWPAGGRVAWRGAIEHIDATIDAGIDGKQLDVVVDAPVMTPEAIRALWPASPLTHPASAHAEAHGPFPTLDVRARTALEGASVDVSGAVTIGDETRATLHADARGIDVHTIETSAPVSRLDAMADATIARHANGAVDVTLGVDFAGGPLGARRAPAARVDATLTRDPSGVLRGEGALVSRDRALPGKMSLRATPKGRSFAVAFDGSFEAPRLDGIAWLGPVARGSAKATVRGTLDLDRGTIAAHAEANAANVARDPARIGSVRAVADVHGPLLVPSIDATADAEDVVVDDVHVASAHFTTRGPLTRAHAQLEVRGGDLPVLEAESDVAVGAVTVLRAAEIRMVQRGPRVRARADEVAIGGGIVRVEGAEIDGLGEPVHLSVSYGNHALRVLAQAHHLELGRLGHVARRSDDLRGGVLSLDADLAIDKRGASGRIALDLERGAIGPLEPVTAHVDAELQGRSATGVARVQLGDAATLELTSHRLEIGGTEPIVDSWRRAWGLVEIDGHVALAKLAALFPAGTFPVDLDGELVAHGRAWRSSTQDETLGVILHASTSHLLISARPLEHEEAPPWVVSDVDAEVDLRADGESGFTELSARLDDPKGPLARVGIKADSVPFSKLIGTNETRLAALRAIVFNAKIALPKRDVATYPDLAQIDGVSGELEATIDVAGPVDRIVVDGRAEATKVRGISAELTRALAVEATLHYDGARATAQIVSTTRRNRTLEAVVIVDVPIGSILDHGDDEIAWTGSAKAHVEKFPLQSIASLSDSLVKGTVTGDVTVDDLHRDARGSAMFTVADLAVGDVTFTEAALRASIDDGGLGVASHLVHTDGSLDASAHVGAKWGAALVPALDPKSELLVSLRAKHFRAAAFLPFVDNVLAELDGRLDANAKATLDPVQQTVKVTGVVKLTEGRLELAALGGEMHDATATLTFTPDGVVTLTDAHASGMSGRVEAAATARVDARGLLGMNARIVVPKSAPILLSMSGVQIGTVDGNVDVTTARLDAQHEIDVGIAFPNLHVQLPLQSGRSVQPLGPLEGARVGRKTAAGQFVAIDLDPGKPAPKIRPEDAWKVVLTVQLGRDVSVRGGDSVTASLEGKLVVTFTDVATYAGQIQITNGTIDVQGKQFDVERGTASFAGTDPANPQIVLSASWTAEDGTKVYAEMNGPLKTSIVRFRSEPSLGQNEILALLLLGTPDAVQAATVSGSSDTQGAIQAAGAAGNAATQPVNRALQRAGLSGVQTRIDTSSAVPRPEVEIPISRSVSLQLAVVLGQPSPGQNLDTELVTVDWRFARAWSLATTVGNEGSTIFDVLWHYRY